MGDERLQALERAWRSTRSRTDEAAYIRERMRAGEVDPMRVELAARCGCDGAADALGLPAGPDPEWREALLEWEPEGPRAAIRANLLALADEPEFALAGLSPRAAAQSLDPLRLQDLSAQLLALAFNSGTAWLAARARDCSAAISTYLTGPPHLLAIYLHENNRRRLVELLLWER